MRCDSHHVDGVRRRRIDADRKQDMTVATVQLPKPVVDDHAADRPLHHRTGHRRDGDEVRPQTLQDVCQC